MFGPLLPLIELPDEGSVVEVEKAVAVQCCNSSFSAQFIQRRDTPLALHAFSRDSSRLDRLFNATSSGSANGNDAALLIFSNPRLPFGGAGASGVGSYHGKRTFDCFVNERATTFSTSISFFDLIHYFVYPPYRNWSTTMAEWLIWSGL